MLKNKQSIVNKKNNRCFAIQKNSYTFAMYLKIKNFSNGKSRKNISECYSLWRNFFCTRYQTSHSRIASNIRALFNQTDQLFGYLKR